MVNKRPRKYTERVVLLTLIQNGNFIDKVRKYDCGCNQWIAHLHLKDDDDIKQVIDARYKTITLVSPKLCNNKDSLIVILYFNTTLTKMFRLTS